MKTTAVSPPPLASAVVDGKTPAVTVGQFFQDHAETLQLRLVGSAHGFDRRVIEPTINRPGLALSGFYQYFAAKRIQVIGSAEMAYLKSLPEPEMALRFRALCDRRIPCVVFSRNGLVPDLITAEAEKAGIAIFRTPLVTMKFVNSATLALEFAFSPTRTEHGSMVDIMGVGTLIRGASGIGKSECVLGLIERGHSLVADDVTRIRAIERRELMATAPDATRFHMEVRGLGVINVASIFGIGSIRTEKRLDLVVLLKDWQDMEEIDRVGLELETCSILNITVPQVTIPIRPGRDIARLVEVAALDQKLKSHGQHSSLEFNQRLLNLMHRKSAL